MDKLEVNQRVDIRRSDGRIHGARVISMKRERDHHSVTVEWVENGVSHGKEVLFEELLKVNPQLNVVRDDEARPADVVAETVADERQRLRSLRQLRQRATKQQPEDASVPVKELRQKTMDSGQGRKSIATPTPSAGESVRYLDRLRSRPRYSMVTVLEPPVSETIVDDMEIPDEIDADTAGPSKTAKRQPGKSYLLRNIENLKKNREDRRAKQKEMLEKKQERMIQEDYNPHWEFLEMIKEYRSQVDFHPIQDNEVAFEEHQICVCVRKRPLNSDEQLKDIDVITVPNHKQVVVHQPQTKVDLTKYLVNSDFVFDYVFDETASNELVYRFTAQPLVKTIFDKGVATCFAYGQTGSGKTHTMGGTFTGRTQNVAQGIYVMTAKDVFRLLRERSSTNPADLVVSCSYFEIYGSKLFDLLNRKVQLKIMEDGKNHVQVVGLTEVPVSDEHEVIKLLQRGNRIRAAGQTSTNLQSSRSHAIFQFILRTKPTGKLYGKFSLIDLAGNEKGADTLSMNRQMHMESAEINRSLLVLKECIRKFGTQKYLPFRASKLTLALRDSFIGNNARTCMIAMISPGMSCCEQTLNTLRYAVRMKEFTAEDLDADIDEAPLQEEEDESYDEDMANELHSFNLMLKKNQEEKLISEHRHLMKKLPTWCTEYRSLLQTAEADEFDADEYATQLCHISSSIMTCVQRLKDSANEFLSKNSKNGKNT